MVRSRQEIDQKTARKTGAAIKKTVAVTQRGGPKRAVTRVTSTATRGLIRTSVLKTKPLRFV
jgi:hypothetical protein